MNERTKAKRTLAPVIGFKMRKIKSGDIVSIPLVKDLGFAFAHYFDVNKMGNGSYPDLIRIFNFHTSNINFDVDILVDLDLLMPPIFVAGINVAIRKNNWTIVGNCENKLDIKSLYFKSYEPLWLRQNEAKRWYKINGISSENKQEYPYEKIKHLEDFAAIGTGTIEYRVAMRFIISEGKNINDYFNIENDRVKLLYDKERNIILPPS